MQVLRNLIDPGGFMPHGFCYLWTPGLIGLHVVSDSVIALSYLSIPITLVHFTRKRRDIPFSWMFLCFGEFIVACGGTHVMEVWTIWFPSYWIAGAFQFVRARFAVVTAILLIWVIPLALSLLRILKENRRTRRMPVIVLNSSKEECDLSASYDLGVNSYNQKPIDFDQFRERALSLARYWLLVNQPPPRQALAYRTEKFA